MHAAAAGGDVLCDKNDIVVLNIVGLDTDQEASNKDDHNDAGLEPLFVSQLCDKRKHSDDEGCNDNSV